MSIIPQYNSDRDRKVKVYVDDVAVSASTAESIYAKFLNFKDRFTVTESVDGTTYDVTLTYADKTIPYEGSVAQGSTPGYLDFNDNHFDVAALSGDKYAITSTGWVKVNALTVKPLNIANATNNEAVTVAEGASTIDLTFNNDETHIYNNGVLITAAPRAPDFTTDFLVTDVPGSDRATIALASSGFIPRPDNKKAGWVEGGQNDLNGSFGGGLFDLQYTATGGTVTGVNSNTHGHARRYVTGSDDNDTIEVATDFPITQLGYNPHIYGKFSLAVLEDARVMMGFNTGSIPTGDNEYLNDLSGFMLGYQYDVAETEDTNWQIIRNGGNPAEDKVAITAQALSSTTPFTFELVGDAANSRWGWNLNGGAFTYYTTEIPTLNTNLNFTFRMEEIGGEEMTLDMYYLYLVQDK